MSVEAVLFGIAAHAMRASGASTHRADRPRCGATAPWERIGHHGIAPYVVAAAKSFVVIASTVRRASELLGVVVVPQQPGIYDVLDGWDQRRAFQLLSHRVRAVRPGHHARAITRVFVVIKR